MAQTGYTPILIYSSSTVSQAPSAGNLTNSTLGSELAINITDGKLFYKDNANAVQVIAWKTTPTTAGGTGLTSYTAGDLLYYATGTTLSKLAIGASTTILTSSGTAPQWSAASGITVGTATNLAGGVAGSVPYQSAAGTTTFLAIGAANRVMTSTGSAPQWVTSLTLAGNSSFNGVSIGTGNVSGAATSVAIGSGALANYTGNYGTAVGYEAANGTFSSNGIAAFGYRACAASTSGSNAGFGRQALEAEASGAANLAVGHYAGYLINGGSNNCIVGYSAVTAAGTQAQLTAVGTNALAANTGSNNTAIGYNAGNTATSGNNNGFFGNGAAPSAVGVSNEYTYGNSSVTDHRFPGGNIVPGTAAKGINFTANTAAAGMTSQLLNWYEEGTFTSGIAFGGGTTGITYGNQYGFYTRIGRVVYVNGYVALTNKGSSTGNATITGFPFTSKNAAGNYGPGSLVPYSVTFTGQMFASVTTNAATATLYQETEAGVRSNLTDTNFVNTSEIIFSFVYIV